MPQIQYSEKYFDDTYEYRCVIFQSGFASHSCLSANLRWGYASLRCVFFCVAFVVRFYVKIVSPESDLLSYCILVPQCTRCGA